MDEWGDSAVLVAGITGLAGIIISFVNNRLKKSEQSSQAEVTKAEKEMVKETSSAATESAKQVGIDVGGVITAAVDAAVKPLLTRLSNVEGELGVMKGDLVPIAVADRDLVHSFVIEGLLAPEDVLALPEAAALYYPHRLRAVPPPPGRPTSQETPS